MGVALLKFQHQFLWWIGRHDSLLRPRGRACPNPSIDSFVMLLYDTNYGSTSRIGTGRSPKSLLIRAGVEQRLADFFLRLCPGHTSRPPYLPPILPWSAALRNHLKASESSCF